LRDQVGDEVRRAEAQARAQVDRLIEQALTQARSQVAGFEERLGGMLSDDRGELARLETSLETRLRELTPRLPNLPRLPG
jgi:F0F1-type ATP synthase membrane subunit b/b'